MSIALRPILWQWFSTIRNLNLCFEVSLRAPWEGFRPWRALYKNCFITKRLYFLYIVGKWWAKGVSLVFYSFVLGKQNTVLEWTILLDVVAHSFLRYIFFFGWQANRLFASNLLCNSKSAWIGSKQNRFNIRKRDEVNIIPKQFCLRTYFGMELHAQAICSLKVLTYF